MEVFQAMEEGGRWKMRVEDKQAEKALSTILCK